MPINDIVHATLDTFHAGEVPPQGLTFEQGLRELSLDYTPASFQRIDALLIQIRERDAPDFSAFVQDLRNQQFLFLLAFYVGTTIERFVREPATWYRHDELHTVLTPQVMATLPEGIGSFIACNFPSSGCFLPVQTLASILFEADPEMRLTKVAEHYLRRTLNATALERTTSFSATSDADHISEAVASLGHLMGAQAALTCQVSLEHGTAPEPALMVENAKGERRTGHQFGAIGMAAAERYRQQLNTPFPADVRASLIYDAWINLPRFRTGTLILEARWHGQGLSCQIALPYRDAHQDAGFALHTPRVTGGNIPKTLLPALASGFFLGFDSVSPSGLWAKYFEDEDTPDNLQARDAQPLTMRPGSTRRWVVKLENIDVAKCHDELSRSEQNEMHPRRPAWDLQGVSQPIVEHWPELLRSGHVVWGFVARANVRLFEPGTEDLPADVVYDPSGATEPDVLANVAKILLKAGTPAAVDALRTGALAEHFTQETEPAWGVPVPADIAPGGLLVSSTVIFRRHLPHHRLQHGLVPLLLVAGSPQWVTLLPARFWPPALRGALGETLSPAEIPPQDPIASPGFDASAETSEGVGTRPDIHHETDEFEGEPEDTTQRAQQRFRWLLVSVGVWALLLTGMTMLDSDDGQTHDTFSVLLMISGVTCAYLAYRWRSACD